MKNLIKGSYYSLLFFFSLSIVTYSQNKQLPKQNVESGAIIIKVVEGNGPFDKQSGSVYFGDFTA